MTKPLREFRPTHCLDIDNFTVLTIQIVREDGEYFVYGAYYEGSSRVGKVTKSVVRTNSRGHTYFVKSKQRYYLSDFIKKTPF